MTRAMHLSLKDLLSFQSENGEIFFKDKRMVITSADAWGLLRKDLIVALGAERAKRFLLRHGWNSGVNDARNLKEMFNWSNDLELVFAGPQTHTIFGCAVSKLEKLDVNQTTGTFYAEGIWSNSFEAEQHLLYFPQQMEPVCHNLLGYAGGYSSEYFGTRIIFKEVECVGKGDKQCRYIGKTVEEWGDEIASELINYEENSLASELDCAYRRIEKQKDLLKVGATIHQKLTNVMLEGKGLSQIAKALGESLECSVAIENLNFELIASFGIEEKQSSQISLKALQQSSFLSNEQHEQINRLVNERQTTELSFSDEMGILNHRLISPIIFRNKIYGFVSLFKTEVDFGELETVALERAAMVCAAQLFIERTEIETEQRMKGKLLDELLNKDADLITLNKRLNDLGYHLTSAHYVFLFQLDHTIDLCSIEIDDQLMSMRNRIINIVTKILREAGYPCLLSEKLDQVYTLVPQRFIESQRLPLKQLGEYLIGKIVERESTIKVTLGVSNACLDLAKYSNAYQEASKSIEISKIKRKNQIVHLASELGHLCLLLNARSPEELERYANEQIGRLYEYDQDNHTELMKTLYFYVENEYNLHKTARVMNISISGMRYRLRRIKEVLDLDIMDSSTRFEVQLALEIYLVIDKIMLDL